jgi:hypothetical protein
MSQNSLLCARLCANNLVGLILRGSFIEEGPLGKIFEGQTGLRYIVRNTEGF